MLPVPAVGIPSPATFATVLDTFTGWADSLGYGFLLLIFVVLLLCGLGLPIPEEVSLIAGGYWCYAHLLRSHPVLTLGIVARAPILHATIGICLAAILLGDLMTYGIGRRWGMQLYRARYFRWAMPERRLRKVKVFFRRHGARTIFYARFVAGVRFGVYFVAGSMKQPVGRFLLLDFIAAMTGVPLSVYLACYFGGLLDEVVKTLHRMREGLLVVAVLAAILIVLWRIRKARIEGAAALADPVRGAPPPPETPGPAPPPADPPPSKPGSSAGA